jgi:hypothetical protein
MPRQIAVVLDQGNEITFKVPEGTAMGPDAARAWLDDQFIKLGCAPLRASGKVLTADKVLLVTQAAGANKFKQADWSAAYVAAVCCAMAKPMVRVDVPSMTITY